VTISLGIIFGIIAMAGWGMSDFFVAQAVRKTTVFKTFVWSQIIGIILFALVFLLFFHLPKIDPSILGIILIAGFLGVISYLAFYKGLQIGQVSVISPIAACWGAVTVILSLIFLHEKLNLFQSVGVSLAILGAVLTSFRLHELFTLKKRAFVKGIHYALIAMFSWGIYFTLIGSLLPKTGWFLSIFFIKATAVGYLLLYSLGTKKEIAFPKKATLFVFLIGLLETIAFLAYGMGVNSEHTSIVAPIGAAFPMVTIILARIFFKERLEINQKIGIVSILTGLILLSM